MLRAQGQFYTRIFPFGHSLFKYNTRHKCKFVSSVNYTTNLNNKFCIIDTHNNILLLHNYSYWELCFCFFEVTLTYRRILRGRYTASFHQMLTYVFSSKYSLFHDEDNFFRRLVDIVQSNDARRLRAKRQQSDFVSQLSAAVRVESVSWWILRGVEYTGRSRSASINFRPLSTAK